MLLSMTTQLPADTQPGKIAVVGLKGTASASAPGGSPAPVKMKDIYGPDTTIKTDKASSVDLFFGRSLGTMRLEESGTLTIDKFTLNETGADTVADVQLNLPEGTILGNVNKLSAASKYEIKVPRGVAGIRGTTLLASANDQAVSSDERRASCSRAADCRLMRDPRRSGRSRARYSDSSA